MTKVIPLPRWIKMSQSDKEQELCSFAQIMHGSGRRMIRCETLWEYLYRILFS